jgi:hypothetical protein
VGEIAAKAVVQLLFSTGKSFHGRRAARKAAGIFPEGLSRKSTRIELKATPNLFDVRPLFAGGYALQLLQDSPELTRHARYRIRGYRSCGEPGGSGCDSGR